MKPVLLAFPEEIETERLLIRAPRYGDGAELREAVKDSLAELRPWMPWAMGELPSAEDYEVRVREGRAKFMLREDLWLMLLLKGTQTIVGGSGLHRMNWDVPSFEIGYWVRTPYAGKGYITEAVRAITAFAFETLKARRVEILCDALNERSAAVARRAGFNHEATLRHDERNHLTGALRDTFIFSLIRPDSDE